MVNKDYFEYRDGKIFNHANTGVYSCCDKIDMEILCNDINRILTEYAYKYAIMQTKVDMIRDIVD